MISAALRLTVTGSTIDSNYAEYYGGGVSFEGSATGTFTNATVAGNRTGFLGFGGGVYHGPGALSTVTSGTVSFKNTLFGYNFSVSGPDLHGTFVSAGNNLVADATHAAGFANGVNGDLVGYSFNSHTPVIDPRISPLEEMGSVADWSIARASPKSQISARSPSSRMFSGLMSRWITFWLCA